MFTLRLYLGRNAPLQEIVSIADRSIMSFIYSYNNRDAVCHFRSWLKKVAAATKTSRHSFETQCQLLTLLIFNNAWLQTKVCQKPNIFKRQICMQLVTCL